MCSGSRTRLLSAQFSAPSAMQASDAAGEYYARHEPLRIHPLPHAYPWPAPYHLPHAAARDPTLEPRDPFLPGMAHAWPPAEQREMGAIGVAWGAQDKSGRSGSAPYAAGAHVLPPHRAPLFAALGPPLTPVSAATSPQTPQATPLNSATLPPRKGKPFEISLTKRCNGPNMLRAQYSQVMKEERAEDRCMRVRLTGSGNRVGPSLTSTSSQLLPSTDRSILCEGCRRYRKLLKARLRRQASGRKLSASRDTVRTPLSRSLTRR